VPFIEGTRLIASPGETGVTGNIYYGLAEYEDMRFTLDLLRPGDGFLDLGANVGVYSILASGVCHARSIAVEPIAQTAERLALNVRLNGLDRLISVHQIGVSFEAGTLSFTTDKDTTNHVKTDGMGAVDIEVDTVDHLVMGNCPKLIKLDVEGYEPAVLKGAKHTLADPELLALIVEINGGFSTYGYNLADVLMPLHEAGFFATHYEPRTGKLTPKTVKTNSASGNTIFVRDIASTQRILRRKHWADAYSK
jgi:FkbM family methyltransferase